jgi:hypothetical protein
VTKSCHFNWLNLCVRRAKPSGVTWHGGSHRGLQSHHGPVWIRFFLDYRWRNVTIRKKIVSNRLIFSRFRRPPLGMCAGFCTATQECRRNLNFCHLGSNVLNRAAETNTAHVYCHDSFINEMTLLKRGSFEEKNLASNC